MTYEIFQGDCRELLRDLPDACIDAIVTDPPYELTAGKRGGSGVASVNLNSPYGRARIGTGNGGGFMGKKWDATGIAHDPEFWTECLRVLKPGGHLLAFGGTRTYHRMTCAIEDAGFAIRDSLSWIYGSGFPKSQNVEKAGAGEAWHGWGTALKPAFEPVVVAKKPIVGTVAANVLKHGTGALNIDGTRVGYASEADFAKLATQVQAIKARGGSMENSWKNASDLSGANDASTIGRWPPNIFLTHSAECGDCCAEDCPVSELDRQSGTTTSQGGSKSGSTALGQSGGWNPHQNRATPIVRRGDTGGASRFFPCFKYHPKASRKEREAGCDDLPEKTGVRNSHPTVKPVELMKWLVRLVTPPNGIVLDPFTGSGSTGVACMLEGFNFVGFEQSAEYVEIAEARIGHAEMNK